MPALPAGCDHVPAPARGPGQPLGGTRPVETFTGRDNAQRSFASGVGPSTIDHQTAGPAAPKRAAEVAPYVWELLGAEGDALHPARAHAVRRARVGRSSPRRRLDKTSENQGNSDDRCTHREFPGTPRQAVIAAVIDLGSMSRARGCEGGEARRRKNTNRPQTRRFAIQLPALGRAQPVATEDRLEPSRVRISRAEASKRGGRRPCCSGPSQAAAP